MGRRRTFGWPPGLRITSLAAPDPKSIKSTELFPNTADTCIFLHVKY